MERYGGLRDEGLLMVLDHHGSMIETDIFQKGLFFLGRFWAQKRYSHRPRAPPARASYRPPARLTRARARARAPRARSLPWTVASRGREADST